MSAFEVSSARKNDIGPASRIVSYSGYTCTFGAPCVQSVAQLSVILSASRISGSRRVLIAIRHAASSASERATRRRVVAALKNPDSTSRRAQWRSKALGAWFYRNFGALSC